MPSDPFDPDDFINNDPSEQFRADRLARDGVDPSQYPVQIDRAAIDILNGIAVGKDESIGGSIGDTAGTIDRFNFDEATGGFYATGLREIAGSDSGVARSVTSYDETTIGKLAFQLNSFRHKLRQTGQQMDIDRALEALLEKQAATAITDSVKSDGTAGAGLRPLRDTDSVAELTATLFSDPRIDSYVQALIDNLPGSSVEHDELIRKLDEPRMTTPLWDHQRHALQRWHWNGQRGYVNMATATGKTVLGLGAIARRYGDLHPSFEERITDEPPDPVDEIVEPPSVPESPRVLIIAGNDLLITQWRSEFEEHLDIPEGRTTPTATDPAHVIELTWGTIEFRTTQSLLQTADFSSYDLVILDEAHRYSSGSSKRGWRDLFRDLTAGANTVLAMSGSIDGGWTGDATAKDALEDELDECYRFGVPKAREQGVIADFSWEVRYAPATGDSIDKLSTQTEITTTYYDSTTGELHTDALDVPQEELPADIATYDDLRSFAQSNAGNELRGESAPFDTFASALLTRKPLLWNLSPDLDAIVRLASDHAPEQKTVILVRSYDAANRVMELLTTEAGIDEELVFGLTESGADRLGIVDGFNEADGGVIVGPGDLLGVGVDLPDAEVAINISKGGANPSLVQRIGRILRNPQGDKAAQFYHVVPRPTSAAAIDYVEDGAQLLEHAAEYRTLGETFREVPRFRAVESLQGELVRLENNGVELLDRIENASVLVGDDETAREHLRRLQAAIHDANAEFDDPSNRDQPVLERWGGSDSVPERTVGGELFGDRIDAYEQYRLALGPYRAAKAVATNRYGSAGEIRKQDSGEYTIDLPHELSGTDFHRAYERWLNEYREWRTTCDNSDGDGVPGSLPEYKEHWPEPRDEEGVMLTSDAAAAIDITYADADPIFFPREDDGTYALPLPDGTSLTVEGIVDELPETGNREKDGRDQSTQDGYELDAYLVSAATASVSRDEYDSLDALVTNAVGELLKASIDGDSIVYEAPDRETTTVDCSLSDRHDQLIEVLVNSEDVAADRLETILEAAIYRTVSIGDEPREIALDGTLAAAVDGIVADGEYDSAEAFVEAAVRDAVDDTFSQ